MERAITRWLAVSGIIPFALCSALVILNWHAQLAMQGLLVYAAITLTSFAAIHLMLGVNNANSPKWFALLSIAPPLCAWLVLLLPAPWPTTHETLQCLLMALCFTMFFAIDAWGLSRNLINRWFFTLRTSATMLAIASLGLAAWWIPLE
ncbi:DUF3429 family protein [bacterium]|nr:DUF3429 family protein [bacterium]